MAKSGASAEPNRPPAKGRSLQAQFAALLAAPPPSATAKEPQSAPVARNVFADTGEPVDVPPPLIEPVGFDEPELPRSDPHVTRSPTPRRSFLAQLKALRPPRKTAAAEPNAKLQPKPKKKSGAAKAAGRPAGAVLGPQLPPLRHFLAPLRVMRPQSLPPGPDAAEPLVLPKPAGSAAIAPPVVAAEPDIQTKPRSAGPQLPMRLLNAARQWRSTILPRLGDRQQLISWGRWGALAVAVIVIAGVAGPRLLHRSAHRPLAPVVSAPSDPAERFAYFKRGADAGDPDAELQVAILYAKGEGVTQDYATAATWFRAAAEQGLPRAQYDLGVLYDRGRGVTADPTQATNWYRKAAEGKYPLAEYNLAVAYTKGDGIRKDVSEAALWYRRAAGQGVVQAMVNLGMLYERGEGVPVSTVDAYAWYLAAGRRGNQPAARRADDLFGGFSQLEQVRAQVLAGDVAGSIHDPAPETPGGG